MAGMNRYPGHGVGFKGASACCLVLLFCVSQVFSSPISQDRRLSETESGRGSFVRMPSVLQEGLRLHQRFARMTPFWRMVGSKPLGAYCVQGLECTTKICRKGHCAYQMPFES
ncbi:liver-expressed antimicrobial peptide 2 [Rhinatrema bivittatum]|uniref:liver-expressed antimicrobial peptide 2 n=1 Tax=Rhinatrema bivittatum TaxID=194408 RepID=UPI0011285942|nr:liver-expressed antimicrobial peptide 2 [Rhinatrema bivittatum]